MQNDLKKKFGNRVRQIRKSRGWTQEELGERSKLDHKYLGAVERGEKNLTIENVEKIAKGFSIEPFQLFLFSLEKGQLKDSASLSTEKMQDLIEKCDSQTRSLIFKISQDIAGWNQ